VHTARYVTWRDESNQVFHYHPEKAQGGRTSLLLELYQTKGVIHALKSRSSPQKSISKFEIFTVMQKFEILFVEVC